MVSGATLVVMNNKQVLFASAKETQQFANSIGAKLRGGESFEFVADLGGGKTTFISGLVAGAGSQNIVGSPTFTVGKQYQAVHVRFYHYDFYRLNEPGLVAEELAEALEDENGVVLVEWAEQVASVLPEERVTINLSYVAEGEAVRQCDLQFPGSLAYLFEGVFS